MSEEPPKKTKADQIRELLAQNPSITVDNIAKQVYPDLHSAKPQDARNHVHAYISTFNKTKTTETPTPTPLTPSGLTDGPNPNPSRSPSNPNSLEPTTTSPIPNPPRDTHQNPRLPSQTIPKEPINFTVDTAQHESEGSLLAHKFREETKNQFDIPMGEGVEEKDRVDLEDLVEPIPDLVDVAAQRLGDPLTPKEKQKANKSLRRVIEKRAAWATGYGDIINAIIHNIGPLAWRFVKRPFKKIFGAK